ncbi:MAG: voltage-gated sodium channel [Parasphingorhabdus sp.]|jgi:voltage-gated sodium channel
MQAINLQHRFEAIRANKLFELFVISIILVSALLVGVKTYEVPGYLQSLTRFADIFINVFFVTEITIRFIATDNKKRFFHDFWNTFDTLIVIVSLIPIDNSDMALVARLVRVFRVLRMVSFIPELRILLVSLIKALPQLGYVMLLMFIIFYIYAAIGSTIFEQINPNLWGDIAISMLTLFRVMTFEDWTDVMYETMVVYPLSWTFYLSFIFFTAFAFLNMVIGIVVNVMEEEHRKIRVAETEVSEAEEKELLHREIQELKDMVQAIHKKL